MGSVQKWQLKHEDYCLRNAAFFRDASSLIFWMYFVHPMDVLRLWLNCATWGPLNYNDTRLNFFYESHHVLVASNIGFDRFR